MSSREPGKKDEPQHLVQGKVMSSMLADMNIHFEILPDFLEGAQRLPIVSMSMGHLFVLRCPRSGKHRYPPHGEPTRAVCVSREETVLHKVQDAQSRTQLVFGSSQRTLVCLLMCA